VSASSGSWHIPALNGLRAVAVFIVIFCHTTPQLFGGGNIGVDLFFVLSGFLITSILLNEFQRDGSINIRLFYVRRALRLFPALALVMAFVFVYALLTKKYGNAFETSKDLAAVATYVYNWRLAFWLNPYGLGGNAMVNHLRSLSVEEQFYVLWPLLLLLILRSGLSRYLMPVVLTLGVLGPWLGRIWLWKSGPQIQIYFSTQLHMDGLAWGATLAWIAYRGHLPTSEIARRFLNIATYVALAVFLWLSLEERITNGQMYRWGFALIGLLTSLMIANAAVNPTSLFTRVLEWKPVNYVGTISYGIYLWHLPFIAIPIPGYSAQFHSACAVTATLVASALSFRYWETPFLRLKHRIGYPRKSDQPSKTERDVAIVPATI
jgi:peptidoglycan/LPS O-acetylase OafA/YrhL